MESFSWDGMETGPWYNPYFKARNVSATYKQGAIKALKAAALPTLKAGKKKLWTKEVQVATKAAAKRAFKTGVTKTFGSFVRNPSVRKKTGQVITAFLGNRIIGPLTPSF